jgi:hypothetical protein
MKCSLFSDILVTPCSLFKEAADVMEEGVASIFRVELYAKQQPSKI